MAKLVSALIGDLISPILGVILGATGGLADAYLLIGPVKLMWGHFISSMIDFIVIAGVVYFGVKGLKLDKLDKTE
ncbi:MAG: MscL family protein [bacterium]